LAVSRKWAESAILSLLLYLAYHAVVHVMHCIKTKTSSSTTTELTKT